MQRANILPKQRVIAGHSAELVDFAHAGIRLSLYQVAGLEALVDRERLLRDDTVPEPPYWAHLWIGARALGRFVAELDALTGKRILDVGCGLGLPGLVAAARGAEVWFVDREPAALEFVRESARENGFPSIRCERLDFAYGALDARFDGILGAEIVYDPHAYRPLCDFLDTHLADGGAIWLTDAFRSDAELFFAALRDRGFVGVRRATREWEDGRPHGLFLWTFRRSG